MPDPITLDTVRQTVREIVRHDPARRNPSRNTGLARSCLYTGPDGSHCLAGEILTRIGLELPPEGHGVYPYFVESGQFTPEALKYMFKLQVCADDTTPDHHGVVPPEGRPWADAFAMAEQWQKIQESRDA